MVILHVAAECFPVAKAGGLGDVVGALPKYQNRLGVTSKVVIPMYRTPFLYQEEWELVHEGSQFLQEHFFKYSVIREKSNKLGFDLYLIDINGLLDREKVYGYPDDLERFLAFQLSVCDWLFSWSQLPDIVHCHDHHCGLVPFIMTQANQFRSRLQAIPTVFTVHNAQYQGAFDWSKQAILPPHDSWKCNLLDWHGQINPLAAAIKTAWRVTTVSHSYLTELMENAGGLEKLIPSVVNISATRVIETRSQNPFPFQFPPGHPFEDLFKDFDRGGSPQKRKSQALGSGFIIDKAGIIITNNHVIQSAEGASRPCRREGNLPH